MSDVSGLFNTVVEHMSLVQGPLPFPVGVYMHQSHGHQHELSVSSASACVVTISSYFHVTLLYFGPTHLLYVTLVLN